MRATGSGTAARARDQRPALERGDPPLEGVDAVAEGEAEIRLLERGVLAGVGGRLRHAGPSNEIASSRLPLPSPKPSERSASRSRVSTASEPSASPRASSSSETTSGA